MIWNFWVRYETLGTPRMTIRRFVDRDEWLKDVYLGIDAVRKQAAGKIEQDAEGGVLSLSWTGFETGEQKKLCWGTYDIKNPLTTALG